MDVEDTQNSMSGQKMSAFMSFDEKDLYYEAHETKAKEAISRESIIAADHRAGNAHVLFATSRKDEDQACDASPVAFQSLGITGLPDNIYKEFPSPPQLLSDRDHIDVFISTRSGTGLAENVSTHLIEPAFAWYGLRRPEHYAVHLTTSETTITELTRDLVLPRANKGAKQTIVLLSGDGGMVDMVNALIAGPRTKDSRKPEIALLPFGTGNALANSSGITGDRTFGLRALLSGRAKQVPVFRAMFSPGARLLVNEGQDERELEGRIDGSPVAHGAVVCSWGLHATLVADSDTTEYRKFGAERFKMAGKEALYPSDGSLPHAYKGKVSVLKSGSLDWQVLDREEHGYVLATLVSHLEAGFHISPSSRPLDGILRLVHFGRLSGDETMGIMTKAYQGGQHVHDEHVAYEEIDGLRIEFVEDDARWRRVCVDGKIIRVEKGGWVEIRTGLEGVIDLLAK